MFSIDNELFIYNIVILLTHISLRQRFRRKSEFFSPLFLTVTASGAIWKRPYRDGFSVHTRVPRDDDCSICGGHWGNGEKEKGWTLCEFCPYQGRITCLPSVFIARSGFDVRSLYENCELTQDICERRRRDKNTKGK